METKQSIVVTGASTGIGYATAKYFRERGWQVFGSVRRSEDAERLRSELGVIPLLFDVTDQSAIRAAAAQVSDALAGETLTGLVNNAGVVVGGPMIYLPIDQLRTQMDVNLIGPAMVTQAFAPLLGADRTRSGTPGRVVQMSSVLGKTGMPFMGPYAASKHALEGMSEALRRELMIFGIDVIVIGPGAILTPIWDKAEASGLEAFDGTIYGPILRKFGVEMMRRGRLGLPAERVAENVWQAMTAKKPKLRYAPIPNKFRDWTLPRFIPGRLLDRLLAKVFGLQRQ